MYQLGFEMTIISVSTVPDVSEILVEGLAVCDGGMDKGFGSRYGFKGRLAIGKACGDGDRKSVV